MSNRAYAWLMATTVTLLVVGVILWRIWSYIDTVLQYALIALGVVCGITVIVGVYLGWHKFMLDHYERKSKKQLLLLESEDRQQKRRREADLVELEFEKIRLQQMKESNEHQRLMVVARESERRVLIPPGHTVIFPDDNYRRLEGLPASTSRQPKEQSVPQLSPSSAVSVTPIDLTAVPTVPVLGGEAAIVPPCLVDDLPVTEEKQEEPLPLPKAPKFWQMAHFITEDQMPLCFVTDDNPESPTYLQTIPIFGTILDLLSLAVIGKPGRGKTVLLIYYTVVLLRYGCEVHLFDPHGVMGQLRLLHGRVLPNMPPTARIYYYDRKEAMTEAVNGLLVEVVGRDEYYRLEELIDGKIVTQRKKHPLLVLADELPVLADFDDQNKDEYKELNRERKQQGESKLQCPLLGHLVRRTVLEARKWNMYFIGSSQSIDASILPTKVTDALNSRIVFYNTERKARMVGLEADVIKKMLPRIRRAGPGMTIYDCARWEYPRIGSIPEITVEDMLAYCGITQEDLTRAWIAEHRNGVNLGTVGTGSTGAFNSSASVPQNLLKMPQNGHNQASVVRNTGELQNSMEGLLEPSPTVPNGSPSLVSGDMQFTDEQIVEFVKLYRVFKNRKECLRRMRNSRTQSGFGLGNRYDKHAQIIVDQYQLDR